MSDWSLAEIADVRAEFIEGNRAMEESDDFPMMPERILAEVRAGAAARCDHHAPMSAGTRTVVGQQFPILRARHHLHAGRLRDHGLRLAGRAGRQDRLPDRVVVAAGGRRRVRPEPGGPGHRLVRGIRR